MWTLREATLPDYQTIYDFQNVPLRQDVLADELPSASQYLIDRQNALEAGTEKYFMLENSGVPAGFIGYTRMGEFWHVLLWGRWLKTLIHCCGLSAFDYLKWPRLVWAIRETNLSWIKVCEKYPFELAGERSVYVTSDKPPYLSIAKLNYYTITAETFFEKREFFVKNSHAVQVLW
jgi:hypothetical protein